MRTRFVITSVILLLLLSGVALAANGHEITRHVIGGGGGRVEQGAYTLDYTIGQPVVGASSASDLSLCSGYWCGGAVATNQPPIADAGEDQSVDTNATVTLDGSASSDPDGDYPLAYLWTQTGGPAVSFTPGISVTTFTAPSDPTVLTFTLAVTDSLGLPDPTPDEVIVTVQQGEHRIYLPLVLRH